MGYVCYMHRGYLQCMWNLNDDFLSCASNLCMSQTYCIYIVKQGQNIYSQLTIGQTISILVILHQIFFVAILEPIAEIL